MKSSILAAALALGALFAQDPVPDKGPVAPTVGAAAPTFRLNDHTGSAVSIGGESQTWTVVAFFPKAATPG